jgi:hypothetical protein
MLTNYDRINPRDPSGKNVGTASTLLLPADPNRRFVVFTNDSDTVIYLAHGTAVAHTGVRLNANGGSYEISFKNLYCGEVCAIHESTGTKRLCIQEG